MRGRAAPNFDFILDFLTSISFVMQSKILLNVLRRLSAVRVVVARTFLPRRGAADVIRRESNRARREAPSRMNGWLH